MDEMVNGEWWIADRNGTACSGVSTSVEANDPREAFFVFRPRQRRLDWIAEKLAQRNAANISQQLSRLDRAKTLSTLPPEMQSFLEAARKSGK
jgi:hypothetical protein